MANYDATARSNYVRFDPVKLDALQMLFPIQTPSKGDLNCILSVDPYGTPTIMPEAEDADFLGILGHSYTEDEDLSLLDVVHLAFADDPGGLFVWIEVGNEKLRYLTGAAIAIDATGEVISEINLDDIHAVEDVNTRAEY